MILLWRGWHGNPIAILKPSIVWFLSCLTQYFRLTNHDQSAPADFAASDFGLTCHKRHNHREHEVATKETPEKALSVVSAEDERYLTCRKSKAGLFSTGKRGKPMFGASNIMASSKITLVSQSLIGNTSDGWNSGHSLKNLNSYGWWFPQLWRDHIKIPMASIVPILDSLIPELYDLMQPSPVFFLPKITGEAIHRSLAQPWDAWRQGSVYNMLPEVSKRNQVGLPNICLIYTQYIYIYIYIYYKEIKKVHSLTQSPTHSLHSLLAQPI